MNNYTQLYWLTRLDGINALFCTIAVLSTIAIIAIIIYNASSQDFDTFYSETTIKERKKTRQNLSSKLKYLITSFIVSVIIALFLPTQKEAIIIVAGGKTMDYVQSDTSLQKIPNQTTKLISDYMEKQIKELNKP